VQSQGELFGRDLSQRGAAGLEQGDGLLFVSSVLWAMIKKEYERTSAELGMNAMNASSPSGGKKSVIAPRCSFFSAAGV
jgi:hypothetical protein